MGVRMGWGGLARTHIPAKYSQGRWVGIRVEAVGRDVLACILHDVVYGMPASVMSEILNCRVRRGLRL